MFSAEGATAPETLRQKDRLDGMKSGEQWLNHSPKEKAEAYLSENSQVPDRGANWTRVQFCSLLSGEI